jgi:hypothetical protein
VAASQAGKRVRCKQCPATFVVQLPQAVAPSLEVQPIPEVMPLAVDELPSVLPADDYHRHPRRRPSGIPLWVWLTGGGVALVLGIVILAVFVLSVLSLGSRVTKANYDKLHPGMTEAEVRSILGTPTQVVDTGNFLANNPFGMRAPGFNGMRQLIWRQGRRAITVTVMNDRVFMTGSQNLD